MGIASFFKKKQKEDAALKEPIPSRQEKTSGEPTLPPQPSSGAAPQSPPQPTVQPTPEPTPPPLQPSSEPASPPLQPVLPPGTAPEPSIPPHRAEQVNAMKLPPPPPPRPHQGQPPTYMHPSPLTGFKPEEQEKKPLPGEEAAPPQQVLEQAVPEATPPQAEPPVQESVAEEKPGEETPSQVESGGEASQPSPPSQAFELPSLEESSEQEGREGSSVEKPQPPSPELPEPTVFEEAREKPSEEEKVDFTKDWGSEEELETPGEGFEEEQEAEESSLLRGDVYKTEGELYLSAQGYKELYSALKDIKESVQGLGSVLHQYTTLARNQDKAYLRLAEVLNDVQEKLLDVDTLIFEER